MFLGEYLEELIIRIARFRHRKEMLPMAGPWLIEFVGGPLDGCLGHQAYVVKYVTIPQEVARDEAAVLPSSKHSPKFTIYRYEIRRSESGEVVKNQEGRLLYDFRGFDA